jgi:hypothetical protein
MTQADAATGNGSEQRASSTDKRAGDRMMRVQIVACLLCLLLVGGSLDTLPDPPAIKPQGNRNNVVSQIHHQLPVATKYQTSDCLAGASHFQASQFSVRHIFEGNGPSYKLTFVRQATDTSPPRFS